MAAILQLRSPPPSPSDWDNIKQAVETLAEINLKGLINFERNSVLGKDIGLATDSFLDVAMALFKACAAACPWVKLG